MTRHSVHIKVDGRAYSGAYMVDRKVLTVTTTYGKKTAQVGHQVSHRPSPISSCTNWWKRKRAARALGFRMAAQNSTGWILSVAARSKCPRRPRPPI